MRQARSRLAVSISARPAISHATVLSSGVLRLLLGMAMETAQPVAGERLKAESTGMPSRVTASTESSSTWASRSNSRGAPLAPTNRRISWLRATMLPSAS